MSTICRAAIQIRRRIAALATAVDRRDAVLILLMVAFTLVMARQWFSDGYPRGYDTMAGFASSQSVAKSLFSLHALTNWNSYWYLGSPSFVVWSPMLSTVEAALVGILGFVSGVKAMYLLFFAISGVFMYFFVRNLTGNRAASFVAALIYLYSPATIEEFIREGEGHALLAFALAPLAFWGVERAFKRPSLSNSALSGITLSLLILSDPQAFPILIGPFLLAYMLCRTVMLSRDRKAFTIALRVAGITLAVALCVSAFWWLPLIFERGFMYSVTYAKQDSAGWSATFWQAITLRPDYLSSSVAPNPSNPLYVSVLQMIVVVIASAGIIMNHRSRYVWFFAIAAVVSLLLAMGLRSPLGLYGFCFDHVPLFTSMRTPCRFLMFTTFCYAVLGGYAVAALWRMNMSLLKRTAVLLTVIFLIIANVWTETAKAFQTFHLQPDQEAAFLYIRQAEPGDYRIDSLPFRIDITNARAGRITNPTYWFYTHEKETAFGAIPTLSPKYSGTTLSSLASDLDTGKTDISEWLSILNVKYVLLDKSDPLYQNVILQPYFERVFSSDNIDIYENQRMLPRVFAVSFGNERQVPLWDGDSIRLAWADGDSNVALTLDDEHALSQGSSVRTSFSFSEPGKDHTDLAVNVEGIAFSADDAIHLQFFSESDLPDISLNLSLVEDDGSTYAMELFKTEGIKAGWNEVNFPISLLLLTDSSDENSALDPDQVRTLLFGPSERAGYESGHEFSLYFDSLSVVTQATNTNVEYTKIRPGKYQVHVDLDLPSYLILSESHHPYWVAHVNGKEIRPEKMYECLNGFCLEPGEYDITLEFVNSPLRTAGSTVTGVSLGILCLIGVIVMLKRRREKRPSQHPISVGDSQQPPS